MTPTAEHRALVATGVATDRVEGLVVELTDRELAEADAFEPAGYHRERVTLLCGDQAWAYLYR